MKNMSPFVFACALGALSLAAAELRPAAQSRLPVGAVRPDGWLRVRTDAAEGYVMEKYVTKVRNQAR